LDEGSSRGLLVLALSCAFLDRLVTCPMIFLHRFYEPRTWGDMPIAAPNLAKTLPTQVVHQLEGNSLRREVGRWLSRVRAGTRDALLKISSAT
jgi:hypothetical protein